jgi:hypothetical protein
LLAPDGAFGEVVCPVVVNLVMADAMRRLWHDPVWSKVIAAGITALGKLFFAWLGNWWLSSSIGSTNFNWWFFAITLLGVLGGLPVDSLFSASYIS